VHLGWEFAPNYSQRGTAPQCFFDWAVNRLRRFLIFTAVSYFFGFTAPPGAINLFG
jgi:hypothetical protein